MLDQIVQQDKNTVVLIFDNRRPITIRHDAENALIFSLWILSDTLLSFEEFECAINDETTTDIPAVL